MARQDQRVTKGGTALQALGDINVYQGVSPVQMAEIMGAMFKQLAIYQADAIRIVEDRQRSFREEVIKRFFTQPGRANAEAFRDPDFQHMIADAQAAYVRSGDEAVRDTL